MIKSWAQLFRCTFNRRLLQGAAIALLTAQAGLCALEVKATASRDEAVLPGQIVTLGWLVTNAADAACVAREHYTLPPDWQLASVDPADGGPVDLGPRETTLRLAALVVPSTAPAGNYTIACQWSDPAAGPASPPARAQIAVTVRRRDKLELHVTRTPTLTVAGERYTVTLTAVNRGNAAVHVRASAKVSPVAALTLEPAEFTLEPGGLLPLQVNVQTPADLTHTTIFILEGSLKADGGGAAEATLLTEVYAGGTSAKTFSDWPALFETRWIQEPKEGGRLQASLTGSTQADDGGRLNYLFRSQGAKNGGYFDEQEQYSADYEGRDVSWKAGHQTYELSPLTTQPQFGFGGAFATDPDNEWSGGVFAMRSRESDSVDHQIGAHVSQAVTPHLTVTLNALEKQEGDLQVFAGEHSNTVSVESRYTTGPAFDGRLEIGVSPFRPAGARGDPWAQRAEVNGRTEGGLAYRLAGENYGDAFFGALRDAKILTASLTQPLSASFDARLEENDRSYTSQYSVPGVVLSTNREQIHLAGLTWHATPKLDLLFDAQRADREFAFGATPTRYEETTGRLGIQRTFEHFVASASVEAGTVRLHEDLSRDEPLLRTNASLLWNPNERNNLSVFASTGNDPYSPVSAHTHTFGGSVQTKVTERLTVTIQAGQNIYQTREARRRSYYSGEIKYQLPRQQTVSLKTAWSEQSALGDGGLVVALAYSRPFGLPLPSLSPRGSVNGTLTDAATGEPFRRAVIVLNGLTTTTDARGRYAFTQLKAGRYQLTVEPGSLDPGYVIREKLPLAVEIGRGEKQSVDLTLEATGRVCVTLVDEDAGSSPGPSALAGVVVRLRREEDQTVLSEVADGEGRVTFAAVRPGSWQVGIDPVHLPPHYHLRSGETRIEIRGHDTQETKVLLHRESPAIRWVISD